MKKTLLLLISMVCFGKMGLCQNTLFYNIEPGTVDYLKSTNALKVADGNSTIATSYTASACGLNYTQASVFLAMRNPTVWPGASVQPAPLIISSLPPAGCKTILKAFLYVSVGGNGIPITATLTNPQNVSSSFSMTVIGQGSNLCWNYPNTYAYRADVTSAITGNGTYSVSGIPVAPTSTAQPDDAHGATLFIIYADNSQSYTGNIVMADGCGSQVGGTKACTIGGFNVCGPTSNTSNFLLLADLQGLANSNLAFNNVTPSYTLSQAAQKGYNWVSDPGTPAAVGQSTAYYSASGGGDCFAIILAGMYYRTSCVTCTLAPNAPTVSVNTSSNPICQSLQSATLTASGSSTFTWSTNATSSSIVVSPTINTTYIVWSTNANGCGSASLTQSVSICNTLTENSAVRSINLYPNPSKGVFKIVMNEKIEKSEITIYNSIGQLIYKNSLKEGTSNIDISKFSAGYYYTVITSNGEKIYNEKIIVE
jgi:hypothetical protein